MDNGSREAQGWEMSCFVRLPRARARAKPPPTEPTEPRAGLVHPTYLVGGSVGSVGMGWGKWAHWAGYTPTESCASSCAYA